MANDFIYVVDVPSSPFKDSIYDGSCTEGLNEGVRLYRTLNSYGMGGTQLGGVFGNFHRDTAQWLKVLERVAPSFGPQSVLKDLTHGFGNNPNLARDTFHIWKDMIDRYWDGLERVANKRGLVAGFRAHRFSGGGGHMPVTEYSASQGPARFEGIDIGFLALKYDLKHIQNFEDFAEYPKASFPLAVTRNREQEDRVPPTLLSILTSASHITKNNQHGSSEAFSRVTMSGQYKVLGIAEGHADIPQIDMDLFHKVWFMVQQVKIPAVVEQAVINALSDAIVACLQRENELLDYPNIPDDTPQFIAVGGLPGHFRDRKAYELAARIQERTLKQVEVKLSHSNQTLNPAIEFIWSPIVEVLPRNNFVRHTAIRVFGIPGIGPRHFIDKLIEERDRRRSMEGHEARDEKKPERRKGRKS